MKAIALCLLLTACGGSDFTAGTPRHDAGPDSDDGTAGSVAEASTGGSIGNGGGAGSSQAGAGGAGGAIECLTIHVQSAVYAANCGAPTSMPTIAAECDGKPNCDYVVDTANKDPKGDPAPGCWKDLTVDYDCVGTETVHETSYNEMVHDNTVVSLSCCPPSTPSPPADAGTEAEAAATSTPPCGGCTAVADCSIANIACGADTCWQCPDTVECSHTTVPGCFASGGTPENSHWWCCP